MKTQKGRTIHKNDPNLEVLGALKKAGHFSDSDDPAIEYTPGIYDLREGRIPDEIFMEDAQVIALDPSADPHLLIASSPISVKVFSPYLYDHDTTRLVALDLSSELGTTVPATTPSLLASFFRIRGSEEIANTPHSSSGFYPYRIRRFHVFHVKEDSQSRLYVCRVTRPLSAQECCAKQCCRHRSRHANPKADSEFNSCPKHACSSPARSLICNHKCQVVAFAKFGDAVPLRFRLAIVEVHDR
jgi:hypothetical protein